MPIQSQVPFTKNDSNVNRFMVFFEQMFHATETGLTGGEIVKNVK